MIYYAVIQKNIDICIIMADPQWGDHFALLGLELFVPQPGNCPMHAESWVNIGLLC